MVNMPSVGTRPIVGFKEYAPALVAGTRREPIVSLPIDRGAKPAASPAADPDDEPPGAYRFYS
jgi:hypothetical protein